MALSSDIMGRAFAVIWLLMFGISVVIEYLFTIEKSQQLIAANERTFVVLRRSLLFSAMFVISLVVAVFLVSFRVSFRVSGALFSWLFIALYPSGIRTTDTASNVYYFSDTAIYGAIVFWVGVAALFGYATKRRTLKVAALLAYPVMLVIALAAINVLRLLGYDVVFDGP